MPPGDLDPGRHVTRAAPQLHSAVPQHGKVLTHLARQIEIESSGEYLLIGVSLGDHLARRRDYLAGPTQLDTTVGTGTVALQDPRLVLYRSGSSKKPPVLHSRLRPRCRYQHYLCAALTEFAKELRET